MPPDHFDDGAWNETLRRTQWEQNIEQIISDLQDTVNAQGDRIITLEKLMLAKEPT